jgi:Nitroreductase
MSLITIDKAACKRDGHCIETCPCVVLTTDDDGYPITSPQSERQCISCGHCVAACPTAALKHAKLPPSDFLAVQPVQALPEALDALVRNRRSIRKFKKTPLPQDTLNRIFKVVQYAPTARNLNNISWFVTRTYEATRHLAGLTADWISQVGYMPTAMDTFNAGGDLVLHGAPHIAYCVSPMNALAPWTDGAIATTTLDLAATARGIGTCWAGVFMKAAGTHVPLQQALRLPEGSGVLGALMLGLPAERFHHVPPHLGHADVTWID